MKKPLIPKNLSKLREQIELERITTTFSPSIASIPHSVAEHVEYLLKTFSELSMAPLKKLIYRS